MRQGRDIVLAMGAALMTRGCLGLVLAINSANKPRIELKMQHAGHALLCII